MLSCDRLLTAKMAEGFMGLMQIQAQLGEGHVSIVNAKEAILTEKHLALVMEYAAGGSLTAYVSQRWQQATHTGLFLGEDEARYFFRVSTLFASSSEALDIAGGEASLDKMLGLTSLHEC